MQRQWATPLGCHPDHQGRCPATARPPNSTVEPPRRRRCRWRRPGCALERLHASWPLLLQAASCSPEYCVLPPLGSSSLLALGSLRHLLTSSTRAVKLGCRASRWHWPIRMCTSGRRSSRAQPGRCGGRVKVGCARIAPPAPCLDATARQQRAHTPGHNRCGLVPP